MPSKNDPIRVKTYIWSLDWKYLSEVPLVEQMLSVEKHGGKWVQKYDGLCSAIILSGETVQAEPLQAVLRCSHSSTLAAQSSTRPEPPAFVLQLWLASFALIDSEVHLAQVG